MKLYGVFGKGSGKVGNSVWAISGGEQIVRPYNPNVSNPNTDAQVAQRAKMKLMSQLGAALASAIAFKKQGLVSARNQFVSKNIGAASFANEKASIDLLGLQLTSGSAAMPQMAQPTGSQGQIVLSLASAAPENVSIVSYFVYKVDDDDKLQFVTEIPVRNAGAGRTFDTDYMVGDGQFIVYAYGTIDKTGKVASRFSDYEANFGTTAGTVEVLNSLSTTDYALTATIAAKVQVAA